MIKTILITFIITLSFSACASNQQVEEVFKWDIFMGQHDLVWEEIPYQWNEGAFTGNGQVGMMIYADTSDNRFDFHVGRQDITDHKGAPNKKSSMGAQGTNLLDFSRLDVGRMVLRPSGKIISSSIRQDIWNAEIRGSITTDLGVITFKAYTPYQKMLNVIEIASTEEIAGKFAPYTWEWKAGFPESPRILTSPKRYPKDDYKWNPAPSLSHIDDINICEQKLLAGGDYATAWKEEFTTSNHSTIYVAIANEIPKSGQSAQVAAKTIRETIGAKAGSIVEQHRQWWHNYYQKSFLSIPNAQMESFYWIQIYKMGTCSREDGPALDLMGPFFKNTSWPGLWWNLNVQLTYWPFNVTNHLDIASNFVSLIDDYFDVKLEEIKTQKKGRTLGDLAWALHNYWLYFDYAGDDDAIQTKWFPKAVKMAEAYEAMQKENENGIIELIPMASPEYGGFKSYNNTNYNLAILRWLLSTLIDNAEAIPTKAEDVQKWQNTLAHLIDYPVNKDGLMIGSNQAVDISHRHYSHLLALYPLFQLTPDSPEDCALVEKSVKHWHTIDNAAGLAGYSFTGASSLYAAMRMGNEANKVMKKFISGDIGRAKLLVNTFYAEGHGNNPVIETPLSAASAIAEFNLQSWGDKIRVFPAVPDEWESASFKDLRAQGGFLVSAVRQDSKTQWVAVKSLKGKPCVIKVPDWEKAIQIGGASTPEIEIVGQGEFAINLKEGEEIIIAQEAQKAEINAIAHSAEEQNYYGVKEGESLKTIMEYDVSGFERH